MTAHTMIRAGIAAALTVAVVVGGFVYGAVEALTGDDDGWPDDE